MAADGPPQFGDPAYWDAAYAGLRCAGEQQEEDGGNEEECFDWLKGWDDLGWLLEPMLVRDPKRRVLHFGCGTSRLAEQFYDRGFPLQYSVDISAGAIEFMVGRNRSLRPEMQWLVGDVTSLPSELKANSFDLIIEKSTLDALICSDRCARDVACSLHEASRLLAPGGIFLSVSMHTERVMLRWLRHPAFGWRVRCLTLEDSQYEGRSTQANGRPRRANKHYAYICSPEAKRLASAGEAWLKLYERVARHPDDPISDCEDPDSENASGNDDDCS